MTDPRDYLRKILEPDRLGALLTQRRQDGTAVVLCHGTFDILHPGHLRHLAWAKSQGNVLVVGVAAAQPAGEGVSAPLSPAEVRAEQLAALAVVDFVVVDSSDNVGSLIECLRPHVYVKGNEFADVHDGAFGRERRLVESLGGEVRFGSGEPVHSTAEWLEAQRRRLRPLDDVLRIFCRKHVITLDTLERLVARAQGKKILVVGETIIDEYVHCDALGLSADSPAVVVRPAREEWFLGGAGIVAQHVHALGAESAFVSVVGRDAGGDLARAELARREIPDHLVNDASRPTIRKKRYLVDGRKLLNVNTFRDQQIDAAVEAELLARLETLAADTDAVVISDFSYGVITPRVIDLLRTLGQTRGIPVLGDVQASSQIGRVSRLTGITVATPSEREARLAIWDRESGLADVGVRLLRETGNRALVITLGHRGSMIFDTGGRPWSEIEHSPHVHETKRNLTIEYVPTLHAHVVDPMGAGDALLATMAVALASGGSILEAGLLGTCASAVAVGHMGNVAVGRNELLRLARERLAFDTAE